MTLKAQPKAPRISSTANTLEDTDGTAIESIYPATGEVDCAVACGDPAIVEQAIASAKRAQPEWAAMSPTRARPHLEARRRDHA